MRKQLCFWIVAVAFLVSTVCVLPNTGFAQSTVSRLSGSQVRGEIKNYDANGITIETRNGDQTVDISEIRAVRIADQPVWLSSAKQRYSESRFENCYETLNGNSVDELDGLLKQEAEFFKAMSAAQIAMSGGDVTTKQAGQLLVSFIDANANSFNLYAAIEMFGDLAADTGAFAKATEYYEKLTGVDWVEMKNRVHLKLGKAKLYNDDHQGAAQDFAAVIASEADNESKLIATCLEAQAKAYDGAADEAITQINALIAKESSDQSAVFARAYNALGCCHLNKGDFKAARVAFMHTQLIYRNERDAYVEALFHLHQISNKLQDSERASRTRQLLKTRYPNSHWASKL